MNPNYVTGVVRLSGEGAARAWVQFALPLPFFRLRFGPYGWWGPWWGWN